MWYAVGMMKAKGECRYVPLTTVALLARREEWEAYGEDLEAGEVLVVMPKGNVRASESLCKVANSLREGGKRVQVHAV